MASFMYTVFSMAQVASIHCSARREISPCTCAPHEYITDTVIVTCEGVGSFNQVFDSLQNRMNPDLNIWLRLTHSQLDDLETRNFGDMNLRIKNLRLNNDQLRTLPESSFRNLSQLAYLSLANNELEEVPRHILNHMPQLGTLDLGLNRIRRISADDFRTVKHVSYLVLVSNALVQIEQNAFPKLIHSLHLGRNNLTTLNGTLRELENMEVLFLNHNKLTTLDNELPYGSKKLRMMIFHHNKLRYLTQDFKSLESMDSLYLNDNELVSFDGVLKHGHTITVLMAYQNKIEYLAEDEFENCINMESLDLNFNLIKSINGSLTPLKKIRSVNLSHNLLYEFSLADIRRLNDLRVIDLSYNVIEKLSGKMENIVEPDSFIYELILHHNRLKSLDSAMMGLNKLQILRLSHNLLSVISPDDLIGLEELEILDISHNHLQTLEETSKTFLPKLGKLDASYNNLTKLEKDFHGLPVLCYADLSNNRIETISPELVAKTRCTSHGVVNKLEIVLQENPVLCKDGLQHLISQMDAQEAHLLGIGICIVPKLDQTESMAPQTVPLSQLQTILMSHNMPAIPNPLTQHGPAIVQYIMPAPIILEQPIVTTETPAITTTEMPPIPTTTTIIPTTNMPIITTVPTTMAAPTTYMPTVPATLTPSTEATIIISSNNELILPDVQLPQLATNIVTADVATVTTTPTALITIVLPSFLIPTQPPVPQTIPPADDESVQISLHQSVPVTTTIPETENFLHETFSHIQVMGPVPDRAQQLLEPEEPPETIQDDTVPTK